MSSMLQGIFNMSKQYFVEEHSFEYGIDVLVEILNNFQSAT